MYLPSYSCVPESFPSSLPPDEPAILLVCLRIFRVPASQPACLPFCMSTCLSICLPIFYPANQPGLLASLPRCQSTSQPPSRLSACLVACQSLIHSFIPNISIAPLQVHYY